MCHWIFLVRFSIIIWHRHIIRAEAEVLQAMELATQHLGHEHRPHGIQALVPQHPCHLVYNRSVHPMELRASQVAPLARYLVKISHRKKVRSFWISPSKTIENWKRKSLKLSSKISICCCVKRSIYSNLSGSSLFCSFKWDFLWSAIMTTVNWNSFDSNGSTFDDPFFNGCVFLARVRD